FYNRRKNFKTNSRSHIIFGEIVDMNKHLVIHTLCEGVETKEQADFLRAIGCDRLQGFYFSKPLPQEEMLALIEKNGLDHYEPQEMNDYYDTIGETNILVNPMVSHISQGIKHLEMPLTLIERRTGDQLVYYFTNFAYKDELTRRHLASYQDRDMYVCSINNFGHYLDKTRRREVKKSAPGPVLIFYMLNFYSNHQPARFSVEAA
ncbi:EAL domain-containing protein, partial [Lactobacillus delbrueckii]